MDAEYDLLTLGGGSGGVRASRIAAQLGAKVALFEPWRFGGTCVHAGCIPKKLLHYAATFPALFRDAAAYGYALEGTSFSLPRFMAQKREELERLGARYEQVLREAGVELYPHAGRILDPHTVEAGGRTFRGKRILIATGSRPIPPGVPGEDLADHSQAFLELEALPKRIVVVGGGYIGTELSSAFAGLGSDVTLVHRHARILPTFDHELSKRAADALRSRGVSLLLSHHVTRIDPGPGELRTVTLADGTPLETDRILWATGRRANSDGIGLEALGVQVRAGGAIETNLEQQTNVPSIFAVGDVAGRRTLTPVAIREGERLALRLFGRGAAPIDYAQIPTAVFCDPPLATVGLTEAEAREKYDEVAIFSSEFRPLYDSFSGEGERSFMKLVVDRKSDRVLGAHCFGRDAPEIVQGIAIALRAGASKADFDETFGIHPTSAEELVLLRKERS